MRSRVEGNVGVEGESSGDERWTGGQIKGSTLKCKPVELIESTLKSQAREAGAADYLVQIVERSGYRPIVMDNVDNMWTVVANSKAARYPLLMFSNFHIPA